jgi:hypothetical protein
MFHTPPPTSIAEGAVSVFVFHPNSEHMFENCFSSSSPMAILVAPLCVRPRCSDSPADTSQQAYEARHGHLSTRGDAAECAT